MVWEGCLNSVGRLTGGCWKVIWRAWEDCLEDVGMLSGRCGKVA